MAFGDVLEDLAPPVDADGRTFLLLHDDGSGSLAAMSFPLP